MNTLEAYQLGLITWQEYLDLETYRICVQGETTPDEDDFLCLLKVPMPPIESESEDVCINQKK